MKRFFLLPLLVFFVTISYAEVYKWVDEKGGVHFTDDYNQIPQRFRSTIERQGGLPVGTGDKKDQDSNDKTKEEPHTDRIGRGEAYWRGRVEEWRNKMKAAQERSETLRAKYNELTEKFNESKSSAERSSLRKERDQIKSELEDQRTQIEEAKMMLEKKLPEDAELFKAKPEWVKP
jgi:hypothetical protein